MREPIKETSVRFQLLIAGTILFLLVFFSVIFPGPSSESNTSEPAWCIIKGLTVIAGYMAFVVLVTAHALLENRGKLPPEPEKSDPPASTEVN